MIMIKSIKPLSILGGIAALGVVATASAASVNGSINVINGAMGNLTVEGRDSSGTITDRGIFAVSTTLIVSNYFVGKGQASGGGATIIGLNSSGQTISNCTLTDQTLNNTQSTLTCPSAPVKVNFSVD
ncbi:MAG TPA: hypothetical protein VMG12_19945 [Polyangiaceae bacterium]|nr:hypothetical protein [Polyangiaceae bacterium]